MVSTSYRHTLRASLFVSLALLLFVAGCGAPKTPNPTEIARLAAEAVKATLTAQPTQPPPATAVPQPTATRPMPFTPTVVPTMTPVPAQAALPTVTPAATPLPPPTATKAETVAVVQSDTLNVRAGPGTGHPIIATSKSGDQLIITGRNADATWLEVMLSGGQQGWVSAALVQTSITASQIGTASTIPTPPPAPVAPPQPASAAKELEVAFLNPHYDCQQGDWGSDPPYWGYRSFQVDMYIKNNSQSPVEPPWKPKRWIITDGKKEFVNDLMWQWISRTTGLYPQPVIQPGQSSGWTFLAFPIDRNQWVKAAEFVWKGQVYRQEFDLGPFGNAHNYQDCGDPRPHKTYPTPTPKP